MERITPGKQTTGIDGIKELRAKCYEAMNDDLNSPIVIAHLFDGARMINTVLDKKATISEEDLEELKTLLKYNLPIKETVSSYSVLTEGPTPQGEDADEK